MVAESTAQSNHTKISKQENEKIKEEEKPDRTPRVKRKIKLLRQEENEVDKVFDQSKNTNVMMPNELRDKIVGSIAAKKTAEKKFAGKFDKEVKSHDKEDTADKRR